MDIGLKVGKQSIGWCVTDGMNIVKKQGKSLIGVNLFNEAETNEQRRVARLSRRMYQRRKKRIGYLNNIFENEIKKIDEKFFSRISEQGLCDEDRLTVGGIFEDKKDEKNYFKKYPTIYHLRSELLREGTDDVRLLYLALLSMFKARGNFLIKDVDVKSALSFHTCYAALRGVVSEHFSLPKSKDVEDAIENILLSRDKIKEKQSKIIELLGIKKEEKWMLLVVQLLLGGKVDIKKLFPEHLENYDGDTSIAYNNCENYEELISPFEMELETEQLELLDVCKAVYDWNKLVYILNGERFISQSYVKMYYQHKEDRKLLEEIIRYSDKEGFTDKAYTEMFKENTCSEKLHNYKAYIGDMRDVAKAKKCSCTREEFYKYTENVLRNILKNGNIKDDICKKIEICLEKIEFGTFMPKQRSKNNMYVPNVVLKDEMKCILDKVCVKHPFLLEKGISGKAVKEELLDIFSFQIPYWVGPINDEESFGWAVHKEPGYVYPWNFEQKIDIVQTRRRYMDSIIGDCCLLGEKVLPDNSYYIRMLQCLDELNKIKICGEKISVQMKQLVFNELTMKYERVTIKGFMELLKKEGYIDDLVTAEDITGFTKRKLNHTMAPYLKAKGCYEELTPEQYEVIAETISVCKNDRKLIMDTLSNLDIPKDHLTMLVQCIKDSGWAVYSKKSILEINGKKVDDKNAPERNLVETLYHTQASLMELLGSDYTFMDKIEEANSTNGKSINGLINEFKNPRQKRAYKQMVNVLKELKNYMPAIPEKLYVNLYIPNNTMVKRVNRKSDLIKLLTKNKEKELVQQLKSEKALTLRKELYYAQRGYCIYTGSVIPYEELEQSENSEYNIEHILPQSKIYDESINNLCLVKKSINEDKGSTYPVSEEIRENMLYMWDSLLEDGYMTQKKYEALTSKYGIPIERKMETVNSLLVENRKTAKCVKKIINRVLPNTQVIFIKDEILNNFKKKFDITENDVVNELSPAREAYYVTVSGKAWNGVFGDEPLKYIINNNDYSLHVYNYNSTHWNTESSFEIMREQLDKSRIIQSVMAFTKKNGQLYKMTNLSKEYALKTKSQMAGRRGKYQDVTKYGGYISINNAYFCIFKTNKGVIIESLPVMEVNNIKSDAALVAYLENLGYKDVDIIKRQIPKKTVFIIDGHKYYLAAMSGSTLIMDNAVPYYMNWNEYEYMNSVIRCNKQMKMYGNVSKKVQDTLTEKENVRTYDNFIEKYNLVYKNRRNSCVDILVNGRDTFVNFDLKQQCEILENIFSLVKRKAPTADLKAIGGTSMSGRITVNNNLSKTDSVIMLEESATGLYISKTKLA